MSLNKLTAHNLQILFLNFTDFFLFFFTDIAFVLPARIVIT